MIEKNNKKIIERNDTLNRIKYNYIVKGRTKCVR